MMIEHVPDQDVDRQMNILVVDDRPENLLALKAVLDDLGENVVIARSGTDALKHVLKDDYAVILLDVQMPAMSGFETASLIRARERSQDTPILFLTATNRSDASALAGYSVGAVDYIVKPLDPHILKAKVSVFVELSRKTRALEAEVTRRKQAEEEVRNLNAELELRVQQRSSELQTANKKLKQVNRQLMDEIAERKRVEVDLRAKQEHIEALNQRLQCAVTETHHRVKNNLQVITALVDMLRMNHTDEEIIADLIQVGQHIKALASLHELLTSTSRVGDVDYDWISLKAVLARLIPMLQTASGTRKIQQRVEDMHLTLKQCASFTLLVNEVITNAIKHGNGDILLDLQALKGEDGRQQTARLEICDDGPGFPEGFDPEVAGSTGLELLRMLGEWDLEGTVVYRNRSEGGASVVVTFPLAARPEESARAMTMPAAMLGAPEGDVIAAQRVKRPRGPRQAARA